MSAKLRPEDLTSEERAIVDNAALFYRRVTGDVGETAEWAYVEALKEAEPIILARRALFAPAPENVAKVECPNCWQLVATNEEHVSSRNRDSFTCQPAASIDTTKTVAYCDELEARYGQPAPPEPTAREMPPMPNAVHNLVLWCQMLSASQYGQGFRSQIKADLDAFTDWWRNLAQPVAVGMTEELRMILDVAESRAEDQRHDGLLECSRNLERAIAAVRQQAAQGRKVELGKVRELVNDLKRALSEAAPSEMTMLDPHEWRSDLAAVFAELDAAEGKRRE